MNVAVRGWTNGRSLSFVLELFASFLFQDKKEEALTMEEKQIIIWTFKEVE